MRGIINDFRKRTLKLAPIAYFSMYRGSISHLPTGYMWSPHVVPKPSGMDKGAVIKLYNLISSLYFFNLVIILSFK